MMRNFPTLAGAFLFLMLGACTPPPPEIRDPLDLVPPDASLVLRIKEPEQFRSDFRGAPLFQALLKKGEGPSWLQAVDTVLTLDPPSGSLLVEGGANQSAEDWLLIVPGGSGPADSLAVARDSAAASLPPEPAWQLPDSTGLFYRNHEGVGLVSPSKVRLEEAVQAMGEPRPGLAKALQATNPLAQASLLYPARAADPLTGVRREIPSPDTPGDGSWAAYDLQSGPGSLNLQFTEASLDSTDLTEHLLGHIPALPLVRAASILPAETHSWVSYSLETPDVFIKNQGALQGIENPHAELLQVVQQLTLSESEGGLLMAVHVKDPVEMENRLRPLQGEPEDFQGVLVYPLQEAALLKEAFSPLLDRWPTPSHYTIIEDAFVFAPGVESLRGAISAHNRKATYGQAARFEKLRAQLVSESNSLFISEKPGASRMVGDSLALTGLPRGLADDLPEGYLATAQLSVSDGFSLRTYQFRDTRYLEAENPQVQEVFTAALEAPARTRPQFLKNHRNGQMDVAVQDEEHTLYLFSSSGSLFWKKELPGPIQGDIQQVDLFRNGRLQMAFSTDTQLMVLDRDGKAVAPFPKEFAGGNLRPLAVFDYENNRNYRLVVTQGSRVFMYDGQGREVSGFKFREAESPVIGLPRHIRIGNRDYLVFQLENGKLRILNRVGDTRVPVRETFEFSNNPVFEYRDGFAFSERGGSLVRIDTRGRVSRTDLNLGPEHGMDATTKTLAFMDDNRFRVKGNRKELDLGVYTAPRIFYLYDIIYVSVTDLQSQQVYLFRSTAAPVPGFPVEGSGPADMADMDNDRNPEIAVPFRDNAIRVYRIRR